MPKVEPVTVGEKELYLLKHLVLSVGGTSEPAECEDLVKVTIGDDPKKFLQIGSQLPQQERKAPGVDPGFICHNLNVNPLVAPKKQPPRRPSKEHAEAVREEVAKLKQAGAIKEVFYPEWLANTVVVKKKSGKWRVCVDFTDLNKACLKDPFPILKID